MSDSLSRTIKPASGARALQEHRARTLPRFVLKSGDEYLHWSGIKFTTERCNAWTGSEAQMRAIQRSISLAAQCRGAEA